MRKLEDLRGPCCVALLLGTMGQKFILAALISLPMPVRRDIKGKCYTLRTTNISITRVLGPGFTPTVTVLQYTTPLTSSRIHRRHSKSSDAFLTDPLSRPGLEYIRPHSRIAASVTGFVIFKAYPLLISCHFVAVTKKTEGTELTFIP
ncbi:hypothetical protein E1B28_000277 [Marasmius oreades]|uniref:Uncharacterized protein n=1 Tax=Marasmius oreades TaxID=181124 RepID=A0A9P7V0X4_9AGAR|nr:uncharacterized protein E1B28_000277 [Marasmius oreades]KAG7098316.1 hypothetical protein E1B28_000277 [Marasmius oreades]